MSSLIHLTRSCSFVTHSQMLVGAPPGGCCSCFSSYLFNYGVAGAAFSILCGGRPSRRFCCCRLLFKCNDNSFVSVAIAILPPSTARYYRDIAAERTHQSSASSTSHPPSFLALNATAAAGTTSHQQKSCLTSATQSDGTHLCLIALRYNIRVYPSSNPPEAVWVSICLLLLLFPLFPNSRHPRPSSEY